MELDDTALADTPVTLAGLLAAKILATSDSELLQKLKDYSASLKESVQKKDARLQEVGYKNY